MLRHCRCTTGAHSRRNVRVRDGKMYVPSDSFGGISPERKASQALQSLFTFISAKVVLAQLEGSGRGALASYNKEQYQVLFSHLQEASLSDSHAWLEQLMRKDKALALRLMEVRAAYSKTDFEWDQLQRLSLETIQKSNLQLMREAATASLQATTAAAAAAAEATIAQEQPAAAATVKEQTQQQQQVPEQAQQEQSASSAPAAEAVGTEAELKQAVEPANSNSSSSTEGADTLNTGAADPKGQTPSSRSITQEQQQPNQQQEQPKQQ